MPLLRSYSSKTEIPYTTIMHHHLQDFPNFFLIHVSYELLKGGCNGVVIPGVWVRSRQTKLNGISWQFCCASCSVSGVYSFSSQLGVVDLLCKLPENGHGFVEYRLAKPEVAKVKSIIVWSVGGGWLS
ncbi:hypothetical protein AVEN_160320-1 [Araneus ventricosus]|uniref:Uncharacterized protein n=1 Tax=Araneus ventricosus TaxID=182803 RepID=A0A4Y2FA04_ARAVE|nr:hypothetical protein AVEN_160320-1 [Araneus ventricosus]